MGMNGALKTRQILANARGVLGIEGIAAAQALDLRDYTPGRGTRAAHAAVRRVVEHLDEDRPLFKDHNHMVSLAARAMRQVLVNHARDKGAAKRGGGSHRKRVTLSDDVSRDVGLAQIDVLALDEALEGLAALDERQATIVELRIFGGLTNQEVADTIGVSLRTVELDWRMAKKYLGGQLAEPPDD